MTTKIPVAIVTGGNSGMGRGLTLSLVNRGWKVAIADINKDSEFAEQLGDGASFYRCDVADYDRYVLARD
jgi:NAD(P)-dependent dehydrogenase (short-subunit alcohol dehydrogenase family)